MGCTCVVLLQHFVGERTGTRNATNYREERGSPTGCRRERLRESHPFPDPCSSCSQGPQRWVFEEQDRTGGKHRGWEDQPCQYTRYWWQYWCGTTTTTQWKSSWILFPFSKRNQPSVTIHMYSSGPEAKLSKREGRTSSCVLSETSKIER